MAGKTKIAISGLGSVSQRGILPHLAQSDFLERAELVACCDVVAERAEATAKKFGWKEWYADYDEMLRRADVDAVLLAGPIPVHYPQAMKALEAGKHVYSQKTMTTTLAQANDVVGLAQRKGLKLVASPGQMLNPNLQRIKKLLADGAIGKLYWVFSSNADYGHEDEGEVRSGTGPLNSIDPTWYYKKGGGPVYDMTVYSLHALTGILGPAKRVTALSNIGLKERAWQDKKIIVEMDDNTLMLLEFADGTLAIAGGHNCQVSPGIGWGRFVFNGTAGTIDMNRAGIEITSETGLANVMGFSGGQYTAPSRRVLPHVRGPHSSIQEPHVYADIAHLIDCIVDDKQPVPSGEHARHVVEIIENAYLSASDGKSREVTTTF